MLECVGLAITVDISSISGHSARPVVAWCDVQLPMAARTRQGRKHLNKYRPVVHAWSGIKSLVMRACICTTAWTLHPRPNSVSLPFPTYSCAVFDLSTIMLAANIVLLASAFFSAVRCVLISEPAPTHPPYRLLPSLSPHPAFFPAPVQLQVSAPTSQRTSKPSVQRMPKPLPRPPSPSSRRSI
jgi:hypothetical protein